MPTSADIAEARALFEMAERDSDPAQETHHIEEALLLLETTDDPTSEETKLIANLRMSYARRLLTKMPGLKSASFDVWLLYFNLLDTLASEVESLAAAEPTLAANRQEFVAMWGPEVKAAIEKGHAA